MITQRWIWALLAIVLIASQPAAGAQTMTPLETIKGPINEIMGLLNDPAYKAPDQKSVQREKMWALARPMFDFNEISRRTVGKAWKDFTPAEQAHFTDVFAQFLGNTYIDKIQGGYQNEKIVFLSELVREPKAIARTKLLRESLEIPIDYRMKRIEGNWKIYDVLVENGVSLVKNYRVQFRSILQKETPAQLIERLEKKLATQ